MSQSHGEEQFEDIFALPVLQRHVIAVNDPVTDVVLVVERLIFLSNPPL